MVSGGLLAAPLAARAQQAGKVPRVGVLGMASVEAAVPSRKVLEDGLREVGYIPDHTVSLEYRFAGGDPARLRQFASDLMSLVK